MNVTFGRYVRTIRDTHEHDWLTFREAIEVSSNIVMAKAALEIGDDRLYTTARDFGFGLPTGVDMTGEVDGLLKRPSEWSKTTLQTLAYGYEVGVTPMQILSAYAVVANGGVLMKPYVVAALDDEHGQRVGEQHPEYVRRVISPETATLLALAFEGVVERGTAKDVAIPGIRIAGKTGTARKVVDGQYAQGQYTASFVGFFPVEDPQIVGLVMMDNPRKQGYYGGITSGPIFRAIAGRVVNSSAKISRTIATGRDPMRPRSISVPDVRQMQPEVAQNMLTSLGLTVKAYGTGSLVVRQKPDPGKVLEEGDMVNLALASSDQTREGAIQVPDVRGMTVRRAMNRLVVDDFEITVKGSGVVRQQIPSSGTKSSVGSRVTLVCEPASLSDAVVY
jgi:cell division protein FtsI (penicillin-binding protein 3)